MTGEERSSERMMEEEGEVVNDPERQRERKKEGERGHRRSGTGEKLIEWGYVRLMRTGNEKIGDRRDCIFFSSHTRGSSDRWGENKHELAH